MKTTEQYFQEFYNEVRHQIEQGAKAKFTRANRIWAEYEASQSVQAEPRALLGPAPNVYIARKSCGCCVGACIDNSNENTGKAVGEWIAGGLIVERVDWNTYKNKIVTEDTFMFCTHRSRKSAGDVDRTDRQV